MGGRVGWGAQVCEGGMGATCVWEGGVGWGGSHVCMWKGGVGGTCVGEGGCVCVGGGGMGPSSCEWDKGAHLELWLQQV